MVEVSYRGRKSEPVINDNGQLMPAEQVSEKQRNDRIKPL